MTYEIQLKRPEFDEEDLLRGQNIVTSNIRVLVGDTCVTSSSGDFSVADYLPQNPLKFLKAGQAIANGDSYTVSFNYCLCDIQYTPDGGETAVLATDTNGNPLNPSVSPPGIRTDTQAVVEEHERYARHVYDRFEVIGQIGEQDRTFQELRKLLEEPPFDGNE